MSDPSTNAHHALHFAQESYSNWQANPFEQKLENESPNIISIPIDPCLTFEKSHSVGQNIAQFSSEMESDSPFSPDKDHSRPQFSQSPQKRSPQKGGRQQIQKESMSTDTSPPNMGTSKSKKGGALTP